MSATLNILSQIYIPSDPERRVIERVADDESLAAELHALYTMRAMLGVQFRVLAFENKNAVESLTQVIKRGFPGLTPYARQLEAEQQ
jgi:hypothetical protein